MMRKKINKYDIALITFIVIINCFLLYYFSLNLTKPKESIAQIYSENELVGEYKLKTGYENEFEVKTKNGKGYNFIKIKNNEIWVEDASCPDLNCVHQGEINSTGQVVVCLPNKMIIKIKENNSDDNDDIDFYAQ
jgi:hypothetical protein